MTIQDLKDNRNEIISHLNQELENDQEAVKEAMSLMVKLLGWRDLKATNVIELADEVIVINDLKTKYIMKRGSVASRRMEEINREMSIRQMRNA